MLQRTLSFFDYADIEKVEEFPCDVFHSHNRAIAMSYFSVGFVSSFISTPLNVYLVSVGLFVLRDCKILLSAIIGGSSQC